MKSRVQIEIHDPKAQAQARPGSNWHPGDFDFFASEKAQRKVLRNLDALPHRFNLTVLVGPLQGGRLLTVEQPVYDDMINVVYCNNVSTEKNWIPMTSWILLHRISHAMATGGPMFNDEYTVYDGPEFNLFCAFDDLWATAYGDGHRPLKTAAMLGQKPGHGRLSMREKFSYKPSHGFNCLDVQSSCPAAGFLATKLFTMKSARENAISNELDIFAEAFAQFLHTGRFRLNPWSKSGIQEIGNTRNLVKSERGQSEWGWNLNQDTPLPSAKLRLLDEIVAQIETDINERMAELARRMVGHQFSF